MVEILLNSSDQKRVEWFVSKVWLLLLLIIALINMVLFIIITNTGKFL